MAIEESENISGKRTTCGIFNGKLDCRPKKGLHKKSKEVMTASKGDDVRRTGGYFKPRPGVNY